MKVSIVRFLINKIKSGLGIVQDTDTATQAISKGKYVFWKGSLKKASSNIAATDTLSSSNLSDVSEGVLNELAGKIEIQDISSSFTLNSSKGTGYVRAFYYPASNMVYITCGFNATTYMDYSDAAFTIASAYKPSSARMIPAQILDNNNAELTNQVAIHNIGSILYLSGSWKRMYFAGWYKVS